MGRPKSMQGVACCHRVAVGANTHPGNLQFHFFFFFKLSHIRYLPNADYRRVEVERAWAVCLFQCLLHNFDARLSDMYKGPAVEAASTQPLVSLHLVGELH